MDACILQQADNSVCICCLHPSLALAAVTKAPPRLHDAILPLSLGMPRYEPCRGTCSAVLRGQGQDPSLEAKQDHSRVLPGLPQPMQVSQRTASSSDKLGPSGRWGLASGWRHPDGFVSQASSSFVLRCQHVNIFPCCSNAPSHLVWPVTTEQMNLAA